jgi:hypothetical protein
VLQVCVQEYQVLGRPATPLVKPPGDVVVCAAGHEPRRLGERAFAEPLCNQRLPVDLGAVTYTTPVRSREAMMVGATNPNPNPRPLPSACSRDTPC